MDGFRVSVEGVEVEDNMLHLLIGKTLRSLLDFRDG